jgi:RHH-type transcriptional regulator, proline utilization regulon repressor / proline dehydrogenase / delta 1-pyrroline-5-carboxylate dehydrogenase
VDGPVALTESLAALPETLKARIVTTSNGMTSGAVSGALIEGASDQVRDALGRIAALDGPLVLAQAASNQAVATEGAYCLNWLLEEVSTSINTAAAGGNASLMAIG